MSALSWACVFGALVCAVICAILVCCEYALVKLRTTFDEAIIARVRAHKGVQKRIEKADKLLRAIHFSIFALTGAFATLICAALDTHTTLEFLAAAVIAWIALMGLFYTFCYLVPRSVGLSFPFAVVRRFGGFANVCAWVCLPFLKCMTCAARGLSRRLKATAAQPVRLLDVERQVSAMGEDVYRLSPTVRAILGNAVNLNSLDVSDIMLPRNQVVFLDVKEPVQKMLERARGSGHTRFPLCDHDLDHCLGLIHIKDVFRSAEGDTSLTQLRRDILRLNANERLDGALSKMLRNKQHMALVVDEFGGTAGVVTLDSIVEEIVGEIRDEFDTAQEIFIIPQPDGRSFRVSGLTPLHDLQDRFKLPFESETVSTLGGLVTDTLGRLPQKGETVRLDGSGVDVRVDETDGRRVVWTTLSLPQELSQE